MYVPPYESLLRALNTDKVTLEKVGKVTIPLSLLKLLLQIAIGSSDFEEEEYLDKNPDVMKAVADGLIESGLVHYLGYGYLEGRKGVPMIDEQWYCDKYPDVAAAIKAGKVKSASEHFGFIGAGEGRSPNAYQEGSARQWKAALID